MTGRPPSSPLFPYTTLFRSARIGEIQPGYPAAKVGLRGGDVVVAVDGNAVLSWDDMAEAIHKRAGKPMELTIERAGRSLTVSVVPQAFKERGPSGQEIEIGRIGIGPAAVSYLLSNPIQAVWYGVARTWDAPSAPSC